MIDSASGQFPYVARQYCGNEHFMVSNLFLGDVLSVSFFCRASSAYNYFGGLLRIVSNLKRSSSEKLFPIQRTS